MDEINSFKQLVRGFLFFRPTSGGVHLIYEIVRLYTDTK